MNVSEAVEVEITVNDKPTEDRIAANTLLSEYLREHVHLTGTHRGCETAKCGACTVLLNGEVVKSCNLLAAQAHGQRVTTVEGLADGRNLHPVQQAYWDHHGLQCGYCTPGFVLSTVALLRENDDPSVDAIREHLTGNLCRCTGYTKIIESVQESAIALREGGYE